MTVSEKRFRHAVKVMVVSFVVGLFLGGSVTYLISSSKHNKEMYEVSVKYKDSLEELTESNREVINMHEVIESLELDLRSCQVLQLVDGNHFIPNSDW